MNITQRRGRLRLHIDRAEAAILEDLLRGLAATLQLDDPQDPITERLFPAGYLDDDDAAAEFRTLTEASLRDDRLARVAECSAELAGDEPIDLGDADVARRWIQVLNDLRLAIGIRIGITDDEPEFRPTGHDDPRVVYYWLTGIQDSVVTRLMR